MRVHEVTNYVTDGVVTNIRHDGKTTAANRLPLEGVGVNNFALRGWLSDGYRSLAIACSVLIFADAYNFMPVPK